jgi:ABC-type transport system involved in multi-copper enzyme maturation permease subunit
MSGNERLLRAAARIAMLIGAAGSLGFMLRAGTRTPRFLLVLFVIWVLSPFIALAWATTAALGWSALTRTTLYLVTLIVALGSLLVYALDAVGPPRAKPAFVYVVVPPASWLLLAIVVPLAAFVSRRRAPPVP